MQQSIPSIALAAAGSDQLKEIEALAASLQLPVVDEAACRQGLLLCQTAERLELRQLGKRAPGPVYVDFVGGKAAHRRRFGGGRGQPLARAVGLKKGATPKVVDATAGLGRDAFVLASLGCQVVMLERSPIIAALLADGLRRAQADPQVSDIGSRMSLVPADAIVYLDSQAQHLQGTTIYLDPMYPQRGKSSLVKKEMRLFHQLLAGDPDSDRLLSSALDTNAQRVVVKRPVKADPLADRPPSAVVSSPNTRYDIYLQGPADAAV